ncbi:MAG: hypothetical protein ACRCYA_06655, partial [Cetobacterium sp.]|uniref:hypothetical protein n=1 Tax=Cetobacterium sp. TaxID=2071632 RepID=UPI003F37B400
CAPGQGYIEPVIMEKDDFDYTGKIEGTDYLVYGDRVLFKDMSKARNRPVKKVVVKAHGLPIFNNITFGAREVSLNQELDNFGEPGLVFPMNLANASTPTLFKAQQNEVNFY